MLKKIYQKDGIIVILNDETMTNKDTDFCYLLINNYDRQKDLNQYKKEYYGKKGTTYPLLN